MQKNAAGSAWICSFSPGKGLFSARTMLARPARNACTARPQCLLGPSTMLVRPADNACAVRRHGFSLRKAAFFASERRALFLFCLSIFRYPSVREPYAENRSRVFGQAVCRPEITDSRRVGNAKCQNDKEEGVSKQKYLKLSSFWKEEYPKGEVVGENIKY